MVLSYIDNPSETTIIYKGLNKQSKKTYLLTIQPPSNLSDNFGLIETELRVKDFIEVEYFINISIFIPFFSNIL